MNNMVIQFSDGNIVLDCQIKTHDGWVARVELICETCYKKVQLARSSNKKDINVLDVKLGHPSEILAHATGRAMGLHLTGMFKPCESCTLGKAKMGNVRKKTIMCSKIFGRKAAL